MPRAAIDESLRAEYPFESRWFATPAGSIHYLDEGPRDAPPLLMLHGNPTWSFYFRRLVRAFSREFRCVVPDHLGCGLSDKPRDWRYDLEGHATNLEQLVLDLDLSRITLVLHDRGGPIGLGFARRHPSASHASL
jgi:haloalkane dehalogenase